MITVTEILFEIDARLERLKRISVSSYSQSYSDTLTTMAQIDQLRSLKSEIESRVNVPVSQSCTKCKGPATKPQYDYSGVLNAWICEACYTDEARRQHEAEFMPPGED
jgi:hypothetical protein